MFEKILSKMGYAKVEKSVGPLIDDHRIYKTLREILGSSGSVVSQPYKQSVWVYAAINTISENLSRVPFVLRKDAGDLEPGIIESGPLYDLFQNPNPLMNCQDDLIRATMIYYCLRGECFWIMEDREDITKIPKEIWTFDPVRFEAVQDKKTGMLVGWKYKGVTDTYFSVNEVIHFKMFNPYDELRGLAPIEAAKLSVDQNYQASLYNKAFFENGATVGGFISVPDELTDESYSRLVKQFEDRHKGASKAHKIAVVEGGGKFTPAKLTQKDMEFIEGKNLTKDEILAVYKVNEVVLGNYENTKSYEGIKSAHKAFWEECLMPKVLYFENVLWSRFFSKIGQRRGKGRIWGQFDLANVGPLQVNYKEKIQTAKEMFFMGWPINHINKRLELGMKEVPWGDEWWVPGGYASVNTLRGGKAPEKEPEPDDDDKEDDDTTKFYCEPIENDLKNKFTKFLFEVRKRAITASVEKKDWEFVIRDKDTLKLKQALDAIYTTSINVGISTVQSDLGPTHKDFSEDIASFRDSRSVFVANNFGNMMKVVIDKLSSDHGKEEKIREVFNLLSAKSALLAKSETEAAFSYGKELALQNLRTALLPSLGLTDEMNLLESHD